jgi:hypothetical protein
VQQLRAWLGEVMEGMAKFQFGLTQDRQRFMDHQVVAVECRKLNSHVSVAMLLFVQRAFDSPAAQPNRRRT